MRTFRFTLREINSPATCASACGAQASCLYFSHSLYIIYTIHIIYMWTCARVYYGVSPRHRVAPLLSAAATAPADVAHPCLQYNIMMSKQCVCVCASLTPRMPLLRYARADDTAAFALCSHFPPRPQNGWYILYIYVVYGSFVLIPVPRSCSTPHILRHHLVRHCCHYFTTDRESRAYVPGGGGGVVSEERKKHFVVQYNIHTWAFVV